MSKTKLWMNVVVGILAGGWLAIVPACLNLRPPQPLATADVKATASNRADLDTSVDTRVEPAASGTARAEGKLFAGVDRSVTSHVETPVTGNNNTVSTRSDGPVTILLASGVSVALLASLTGVSYKIGRWRRLQKLLRNPQQVTCPSRKRGVHS